MARANRHYYPGYVWHITHRCHKKDFLLKFARDRRRWMHWLFEARKRYGLSILNYVATSNHIHLLVFNEERRNVIPRAIQLVAGRTGQEYNTRKNRKGAFWEDRYHATAVSSDSYLIQCLVYIDLNMVRAGVVGHPAEWGFGGYVEIQKPRKRYALIDYNRLMYLLNVSTMEELRKTHHKWVEEAMATQNLRRQPQWSQSVAVGSEHFVEEVRTKLGVRVKGRKIEKSNGVYSLRESRNAYIGNFTAENGGLSPINSHLWDVKIK